MPVVGGARGQRRAAELAVDADPEVRDPPALRVHGPQDVVLHQGGQPEVLRRERTGGVVAGHGARVVGGAAGVEVDANEDVCLGHVGAHVAGRHIVVHALGREEAARDVVGLGAADRRRAGPGHDHGEALGLEELGRVELERERLVGLVNGLARLRLPDATGIDAAVAGVEEDGQVAVARGRGVRHARPGLEEPGVDGMPAGSQAAGGRGAERCPRRARRLHDEHHGCDDEHEGASAPGPQRAHSRRTGAPRGR